MGELNIRETKIQICKFNRFSIVGCNEEYLLNSDNGQVSAFSNNPYSLENDNSTMELINICKEKDMNCAKVSFDICLAKNTGRGRM